jgi:hypothetical protein
MESGTIQHDGMDSGRARVGEKGVAVSVPVERKSESTRPCGWANLARDD